MGSLSPIHLLLMAVVAVLLVGGHRQILKALGASIRPRAAPRRFFDGMNPVTVLALTGALLLALALLIDVYSPDGAPGAASEDVSLGFAGSGAVLVLVSIFLDRRSRR